MTNRGDFHVQFSSNASTFSANLEKQLSGALGAISGLTERINSLAGALGGLSADKLKALSGLGAPPPAAPTAGKEQVRHPTPAPTPSAARERPSTARPQQDIGAKFDTLTTAINSLRDALTKGPPARSTKASEGGEVPAARRKAEAVVGAGAVAGEVGETLASSRGAKAVARQASQLQVGLQAMLEHLRTVSAELQGSRTSSANLAKVAAGIGTHFTSIQTNLTSLFGKLEASLATLGEITIPALTVPPIGAGGGVAAVGGVSAEAEAVSAVAAKAPAKQRQVVADFKIATEAEEEAKAAQQAKTLTLEQIQAEQATLAEQLKVLAAKKAEALAAEKAAAAQAAAAAVPKAPPIDPKLLGLLGKAHAGLKPEGLAQARATLGEVLQRGGSFASNVRPGELPQLEAEHFQRLPSSTQAERHELAGVKGAQRALEEKARLELESQTQLLAIARQIREQFPGLDIIKNLELFPKEIRKTVESVGLAIGYIDRLRLALGELAGTGVLPTDVQKKLGGALRESEKGPVTDVERAQIAQRGATIGAFGIQREENILAARQRGFEQGVPGAAAQSFLQSAGLRQLRPDYFAAQANTPELRADITKYNAMLEEVAKTFVAAMKATGDERIRLEQDFNRKLKLVEERFATLTGTGQAKAPALEDQRVALAAGVEHARALGLGRAAGGLGEDEAELQARLARRTDVLAQNQRLKDEYAARGKPTPPPPTSQQQFRQQLAEHPAVQEVQQLRQSLANVRRQAAATQTPAGGVPLVGRDIERVASFISLASKNLVLPLHPTTPSILPTTPALAKGRPEAGYAVPSGAFRAAAERASAQEIAAGKGIALGAEKLGADLVWAANTVRTLAERVGAAALGAGAETVPRKFVRGRAVRAGEETVPSRYVEGRAVRDQPSVRGPIIPAEPTPARPAARPAAVPATEEARRAPAAPKDGQTSILQQILQTLHAMLQCCHEQLARMGAQGPEARGVVPGAVPGAPGYLPPGLRPGAAPPPVVGVAASAATETAAAEGRLAQESNQAAAAAKRFTAATTEAAGSARTLGGAGRQATTALNVLAGLRAGGSLAPGIRAAGGKPIEFARQLVKEEHSIPKAAELTAAAYGGDRLAPARKELAAALDAEAATSRGNAAADKKSTRAKDEENAAVRARTQREETIANIEGKFSAETRAAIAQMLQLERALGGATASVSQLGKFPEVGQARAKVAGLLGQEPAIGKGSVRPQRIGEIVGATGPELTDLRRQGAFAVESYSQGALQAAQASGLAGSLQKIFFGNQSFLTSVAHTAGRFIIRNFSAVLIFGIQNAIRTAFASVFTAEQSFVRLSNAIAQTGGQVGALRAELQGVAVSLGTPLEDTYKIASQLVGAFENPADIAFGTEIITRLEKISQGALNGVEGVRSLRAVTTAFGDEGAESLEHVADVVTRLQDLTGVNLEDVIEGLASIGELAKGLNLSLEFTGALVAQVAKGTGQSGQAASEGLGRILSRLQNTAIQGQLQTAGLATQEQFSTGDYQGVIESILRQWETLSQAQQDAIARTLGGVREQRYARAFLEEGASLLTNASKAADSFGASAERTAEIMKTLRGEFTQVRQGLVALVANLVHAGVFNAVGLLVHVFNQLLSTVVSVFSAINRFADENAGARFARSWIASIAGFIGIFVLGSKAVRAFQGELTKARLAATTVATRLGVTQAVEGAGLTTGAARRADRRARFAEILPDEARGFRRTVIGPQLTRAGQAIQQRGFLGAGLQGIGGFLSPAGELAPTGRLGTAARGLGDRMLGVASTMNRGGRAAAGFGQAISSVGTHMSGLAKGLFALGDVLAIVAVLAIQAYQARQKELDALRESIREHKKAADETQNIAQKTTQQQKQITEGATSSFLPLLGSFLSHPITFLRAGDRTHGDVIGARGGQGEARLAGMTRTQFQEQYQGYSGRLRADVGQAPNIQRELDERIAEVTERRDLTQQEKTGLIARLQKFKQDLLKQADEMLAKQRGLQDINRVTDDQIESLDKLGALYSAVPASYLESRLPGIIKTLETGVASAGSDYLKNLKEQRGATVSGALLVNARRLESEAAQLQKDLDSGAYSPDTPEFRQHQEALGQKLQEAYQARQQFTQTVAEGAKALADMFKERGDVGPEIALLNQAAQAYGQMAARAASRGDAAAFAQAFQNQQAARQQAVEAAYRPALQALDVYQALTRNPLAQARFKLDQASTKLNYMQGNANVFSPDQIRQSYIEFVQAENEVADKAEELAQAQANLSIAGITDPIERGTAELAELSRQLDAETQRTKKDNDRIREFAATNLRQYNEAVAAGDYDRARLFSGAPPPPGFSASGQIPGRPGDLPSADPVRASADMIVGTLKADVVPVLENRIAGPLESILTVLRGTLNVQVGNLDRIAKDGTVDLTGKITKPEAVSGSLSLVGRIAQPSTKAGQPADLRPPKTPEQVAAEAEVENQKALAIQQQQIEKAKQIARDIESLAQARAATAQALVRDPLQKSLLQLGEANRHLAASAGLSAVEVEQANQELIQAQQAVADAYHELNQAIIGLAKAQSDWFGNTVESARLGVAAANDQLSYAIQQYGAGSTQVLQAQAGLTNAQAQYRDTILSEQMETVDFLLQMGDITSGAAIQMLQQLLRNGDLTEKQRRSLLLKIKGLQDDLKNSLSQGFNIPSEIRLPTAYEVRRSLAGQNALKPSTLATVVNTSNNVTNNNTFNQTVSSPAQVQQIAQAVVGILNDQTTQAVRSNQSTPHLVGV